jgi:hypothetical protein
VRNATRELVRAQADEIRYLRRRCEELENKLLFLIDKPFEVPPIDVTRDEPMVAPDYYDPLLEVLD